MKSKLFIICTLAVLGFGIISCAPDDSSGPSANSQKQKISPPILVAGDGGELNLKNYVTAQSRSWSLSDRLIFPETGVFNNLSVEGKCFSQGVEYINDLNLTLKKEFKIFEILPQSLLTLNLGDEKIECSLEFSATSPNGDRHGFNLKDLVLSKLEMSSISLRSLRSQDSINMPLQVFSFSDGMDIQIQFPNGEDTTPFLLCNGIDFQPRIQASSIRSLADFAYLPLSTNKELKKSLISQPLRLCRVITKTQAGSVNEVSPLFALMLGKPPVTLTSHISSKYDSPKWSSAPYTDFPVIKDLYENESGTPILEMVLTNESQIPQFIRIPRSLSQVSESLIVKDYNLTCFQLPPQFLSLVTPAPLEIIQKTDSSVIVKVPPAGAFPVSYNLAMGANNHPTKGISLPLRTVLDTEAVLMEWVIHSPKDKNKFISANSTMITLPAEVIIASHPEAVSRRLLEVCR